MSLIPKKRSVNFQVGTLLKYQIALSFFPHALLLIYCSRALQSISANRIFKQSLREILKQAMESVARWSAQTSVSYLGAGAAGKAASWFHWGARCYHSTHVFTCRLLTNQGEVGLFAPWGCQLMEALQIHVLLPITTPRSDAVGSELRAEPSDGSNQSEQIQFPSVTVNFSSFCSFESAH